MKAGLMQSKTYDGWHSAKEAPPVNKDGFSDFMLVVDRHIMHNNKNIAFYLSRGEYGGYWVRNDTILTGKDEVVAWREIPEYKYKNMYGAYDCADTWMMGE